MWLCKDLVAASGSQHHAASKQRHNCCAGERASCKHRAELTHFIVTALFTGVKVVFCELKVSMNPPTAAALATMEAMVTALTSRRPAKAENATMILA
jgi:hypothetical protein